MKKLIIVFGLLFLLSIPAIKSLLPPGGYTSHDLTHHIVRQIDMDKLLREGRFPPRWSGDLNQGYGYPLFLFNYSTPAFVGEVFHKLGLDFVESVKGVLLLSLLISVIGMYLFLDSLFPKNKIASFLGAIFYLYAPVRFLNVYVSADIGSALAQGLLPYVFWAIVKVGEKKKWAVLVGSLFLALLITSHNITTLMFTPVILIFSMVLIYMSKEKLALFKNLALIAILGFGLAAFFWIPAVYEIKYINYNQTLGTFWINQFPSLWQTIHSAWGYGLSHPEQNNQGGISFQIGLAHIFVIFALTGTMFIFRKKKELLAWGIFVIGIFFISVFLQLRISTPVWAHLPLLYLVQFPSRFMAISVFVACIAAALLVKYLPFKKIVFVLLLALVLYANRNHLNVNQKFAPGMAYYLAIKDTTTSANEHSPKWAYIPQSLSPGKLIFLKGSGNIKILENKSAKVAAEINVQSDSTLRFNQFYFPGWVLKDNGKPIQFSYTGGGDSHGLPVFTLTKGSHTFEADFTDTLDRKVADTISLMSLGVLGYLLIQILIDLRSKNA